MKSSNNQAAEVLNLCSVATPKYPESFPLEIYVCIVTIASNLRRVLLYRESGFLEYIIEDLGSRKSGKIYSLYRL